jgi:hypothetical protein
MNAEQDKPFRPMLRIGLIPFLMGVAWFAPGWPHAAIEGAVGLLMLIATIMAIFGALIWVVPEGGFT